MYDSDTPTKLPIPFASAAGGGYIRSIPTASQIGITDGAASLHDGFVPLNATPIGAGGVPPDIKDMNGILYEISGWARWQAAGGPIVFDAGFATAIGGYPSGAVVRSGYRADVFFVSVDNNNMYDPEGPSGYLTWHLLFAEAASNAETAAGSVADKYVSPAALASIRAVAADVIAGTTVQRFLTPKSLYDARASAAEVLAGTDDHKYLTSKALADGLGFVFADGTQSFKIGPLVIKRGTFAISPSGYANIVYPTAFSSWSHPVVSAMAAPGNSGDVRNVGLVEGTQTASGFQAYCAATPISYGAIPWLAIGD